MIEINGRPAVERHIGWPDSADNNLSLSYFSVITINYMTLNMFPTEFLDSYDKFLKEMSFTCVWEGKPTFDKRHKRLRRYEHTHLTAYDGKPLIVDLLLYPKKKKERTEITSIIYYPTKEILDFFVGYFLKTQLPNISYLELTLDSYTNQPQSLFDLFDANLFMKYNRLNPNKQKTTSYQQTEVKSKGMRLYIKEDIDQNPVRLELMFRRAIIQKLEIKLETLDQDLQKIDYSRFFGFKSFDEEKYRQRQSYRMEKKFKEDRQKKNRPRRESWTLDDSHSLHRNLVNNVIENLLLDSVDNSRRPVAYINSDLKVSENKQQSDFFPKLPEMDEVFFSGINGRSFL